jgi:CheY-like chemotaxis protein
MLMATKIVILEDNLDRQAVMRACLAELIPLCLEATFLDDVQEMIRFLEAHLADTLIISLDHDLDLKPGLDGRSVDPGTGREVADYLAAKSAACPVVIATTNSRAGDGMQRVLRRAGWKTRRIIPFDDMNWIKTDWFSAMRRAVVGPASERSSLGGQT